MFMVTLLLAGTGSGGMVVLDLLSREPQVTRLFLIEPDTFQLHNVVRHLFPLSGVGQRKIDLAAQWIQDRRTDLEVISLPVDLLDPAQQTSIEEAVRECDLGICAVDNEPAKYHFDALMRKHSKPWTLGEVLSGGIGGWVHRFLPGGACYGCVASFLQRSLQTDNRPAPDYANPEAMQAQTRIPASGSAIHTIAGLHAMVTQEMIQHPESDPGFSSLLMSLMPVEGIFKESFESFRFRIPRSPDCLICHLPSDGPTGEALDVAVAEALARLLGS